MKHKKVLGSTGLLLFYLGVFLVFIAPIVRLLFMSLKGSDGYGLSNYQVLLQEKRTREAIFNTILIAASSTMIAIVAGSGLALAAAYTNIKRKRLLELLVLLPFIIPSYIITLSWSGFLSKKGIVNQILGAVGIGPVNIYSIGGILLVIGICNIPVVYMSVIHMLRRIQETWNGLPEPADLVFLIHWSMWIWCRCFLRSLQAGFWRFYQPLITSLCRHF